MGASLTHHQRRYFFKVSIGYFIYLHFLFWFFRYFLYIHFKCYSESSLYYPPALLPYPPTPNSWPWCSPVLGHIKFAIPRGLSSQWWPTRPSSATYAARGMSSGGYWLVHIVVPPIGLQTPSVPWVLSLVSPLGGPVFHLIDDWEHKELQRQSLELRRKDEPSRDYPTRESIP